jgi:multidrug efflux system membrane fusion protein
LVVPSAAMQSGMQGSFVWVVDADAKGATTTKIQLVKIALAEGQVTILDSGVQPGEKVVVDGADRLRPGQIVQVSQPRQQTVSGAAGQGAAGVASAEGGKQGAKPETKEKQ